MTAKKGDAQKTFKFDELSFAAQERAVRNQIKIYLKTMRWDMMGDPIRKSVEQAYLDAKVEKRAIEPIPDTIFKHSRGVIEEYIRDCEHDFAADGELVTSICGMTAVNTSGTTFRDTETADYKVENLAEAIPRMLERFDLIILEKLS